MTQIKRNTVKHGKWEKYREIKEILKSIFPQTAESPFLTFSFGVDNVGGGAST